MMEEKKTLKLRSTGRMSFSRDARSQGAFGETDWRGGPSRRGHEVPAWRGSNAAAVAAEESGSAYVTGERIRHKLFVGGRIEELSGSGKDVKAVIEFDDANVGRKTIKLAYTTLERGQT
jgi:hypothetical protein